MTSEITDATLEMFSCYGYRRYNAVPPMGPFASEVPDFAGFLKAVRHEFEKAVSAASHSMDVGRLQATERLAKCLIVLCRFAETSWFIMFVYSRCLQRFSAYVRMLLSSDKKK